ncbi:Panacea domain-containing protein [Caminicella sporogenes]|uniref:Panacea domain-containing protein n=1 Tax=Caminicella sporogenes TaxID=166485 RepID=UPI002541AFF0|nr:type II toxin-antitoxin system antitoxin SocA domain-containing protein [Caminicella sporogenes]WIF95001.1 DUF4065 domain-containing protein [Caminicella sporogenes]WIF95106.1 DUF4065 domain-containing protein [Caminicella sporogenes]
MKREITIFDIAKTFLSFESMTHKKLQKLCYYAQAWHLAINDEPLVKDARFEAWVHGPVSPELYQEYKEFGAFKIPKRKNLPQNITEDSYEYAFLRSVYQKYGHLSGDELETLTHTEEPWLKARARDRVRYWEPSNEKILEEDMMNFYRKEMD